jgi:hypothetical protein
MAQRPIRRSFTREFKVQAMKRLLDGQGTVGCGGGTRHRHSVREESATRSDTMMACRRPRGERRARLGILKTCRSMRSRLHACRNRAISSA